MQDQAAKTNIKIRRFLMVTFRLNSLAPFCFVILGQPWEMVGSPEDRLWID